jgi:hypothetical protein
MRFRKEFLIGEELWNYTTLAPADMLSTSKALAFFI